MIVYQSWIPVRKFENLMTCIVLFFIVICGHCVKHCTTIHSYPSSRISSGIEISLSASLQGTCNRLSRLWINGANKWSLATSFRVKRVNIYFVTLPQNTEKNKSSEQMWEWIKRAVKASHGEHHINQEVKKEKERNRRIESLVRKRSFTQS